MYDDYEVPTYRRDPVAPLVLALDDETRALLKRLIEAIEALQPVSREEPGTAPSPEGGVGDE